MNKLKMDLKSREGITLISLVVTIIILIILASISIAMILGNNGLLNKAQTASDETKKSQATETMNLKITNIQISSYAETQELPNLQYLADKLCEDNDMEYVLTASKEHASLDKIDVTNISSIFTKLKEYPYEFEINNSLQLASIDGIQIAETNKGSANTEFNPNIYDRWDTWLNIAGIINPEQYNDTNIVENNTLMNKLLSNDAAIDYMLKSKYFILPAMCSSENAIESIIQNTNLRKKVILNNLWREKLIQNGFINKFDNVATKVVTSSSITDKMLCSSTNKTCSVSNAFNGVIPNSNFSDNIVWIPTASEKDSYIGYNFDKLVKLYKMSLTVCTYESTPKKYSFILQGLTLEKQWENIGNEYVTNLNSKSPTTLNYYIDCNKAYSAYRIINKR